MERQNRFPVVRVLVILLFAVVIWQNISLQNQLNGLRNEIANSMSQYQIQNELYSISQRLNEMAQTTEQSARASYGETVSIIGLRGDNSKLIDIEVSFSLKETVINAEIWVTAKDDKRGVTQARAEYFGGVYTVVLPLDAARTYSILYESKGTQTVTDGVAYSTTIIPAITGELMSYYQPKDELLERFKVNCGYGFINDTFEFYPYLVNVHDGNEKLKIKALRMEVIQQTPEEKTDEIDLMSTLSDDGSSQYLQAQFDTETQLAIAAGRMPAPLEGYATFSFPALEHCDYTVKIIITDNLGYTYTHIVTFNRRGNTAGGGTTVGDWLTIS